MKVNECVFTISLKKFAVPRSRSSILEGEETQEKKMYGLATVSDHNQSLTNSHKESIFKPNFASDFHEMENNFGPTNANGNNILPFSSVGVENQLVGQLKNVASENKQIRENLTTETFFPEALILHDSKSNKHNGQKIKGIVETKRQIDVWKSNRAKSETTDIVLAEPKIYFAGVHTHGAHIPHGGSDKTVDAIKNLIHNQHSMLKSSISLGSHKGHKKVNKRRFSKLRQRQKIFDTRDNDCYIGSAKTNRYVSNFL